MNEKYDERYERQIALMAENKLETGKFHIFDAGARVVKRVRISDTDGRIKTEGESCLVLTNRDGETILITTEFERVLLNALNSRSRS